MSLPYRWYPQGARHWFGMEPPPIGTLVAWEHAVYRVVELIERPADLDPEYRWHVIIRPVHDLSTDRKSAGDLRFKWRPGAIGLDIYRDGHYPICAACLEPLPCREQSIDQYATESTERMDRHATRGVCPACSEVVTHRQASHTFAVNLELPGGPPVTFHTRGRCIGEAVAYERRLVRSDPATPRRFWCGGDVINHRDLTYECTRGADCPGPKAQHCSMTTCARMCCEDLGGHARGCFPHPTATVREVAA